VKRVGQFVLLVGFVIAAVGTAQFAWVVWTSYDPNPNPAGNGVLMVLSWAAGIIVFGVGAVMAGLPRRWPWV
jgi:hypothetical protein